MLELRGVLIGLEMVSQQFAAGVTIANTFRDIIIDVISRYRIIDRVMGKRYDRPISIQ